MFQSLSIVLFGLILWLGLYLLNRDIGNPRLRYAGLALVSFAFGICCLPLSRIAPSFWLRLHLNHIAWLLFSLPSLFWTATLIYFLPETSALRMHLARFWHFLLAPFTLLCLLVAANSDLFFGPRLDLAESRPAASLFLMTILLLPLLVLLFPGGTSIHRQRPGIARTFSLLLLCFALISAQLILLPLWPLQSALLLIQGCILLLLGILIAAFDSQDLGEALLPDIFRSLDYSFFTALLFAGQVGLIMLFFTGVTFPLYLLLSTILATTIAVQVFAHGLVAWLDRIAFASFPALRKERAQLHTIAETLPRLNQDLNLDELNETEFIRLTRRALSQFGDISRLASNPLTGLQIVKVRLIKHGVRDDALGRATELKTLLTESIARLKPRGEEDFGISDEWRYYNALYFPYVVGLKPYSRRTRSPVSDPTTKTALHWFQTQVPERTLYNWQTAAAKLVAQDLRSKDDHEE